ncbi:MAG: ferredoxin-type protein NapF [Gammaproteobacteria bacterium]|nr:ferredoxin-type protein NapF [Gammaproteobacteria bacterium]
MEKAISRAQFLRGDFTGKRRHIRPPWSGSEREFTGTCRRCDACIKSCPENILSKDNKGFPRVDFNQGECTFCGECVTACQDGVLKQSDQQAPWSLFASINEKCLPLQGVVCGRCAEECETTAIRMKLVAGGISIPQLETAACTGCGACYRTCPTQAIELSYHGANT